MSATPCPFCEIVEGEAPATVVREWDDALAIVPLNPVVDGHVLVIPKRHVQTVFSDPETTASTMRRVAEFVHSVERHEEPRDHNVITSAGRAATQTVMHMHVHIVPRTPGDGLMLPWTPREGNVRPAPAGDIVSREQFDGIKRALEWYANAEHYMPGFSGPLYHGETWADNDRGKRARDALAALPGPHPEGT